MVTALGLAISDLADRGVIAVLIRSLVVTLAIFGGLALLLAWTLAGADPCGWLADASCPLGIGGSSVGAALLTLLGIWFLFPAIALGVIAGYGDRIVAAVEARHYPAALAAARPAGAGGALMLGLRSSGRLLLYNLAALPFYLLLLVTGIGPLLLFVAVNGLAAGRDFGELAATRHGDRNSRRRWLRTTRGDRALIGIAAAGLFLVPVLNLLAPVLGAAAATHLFHRRGAGHALR